MNDVELQDLRQPGSRHHPAPSGPVAPLLLDEYRRCACDDASGHIHLGYRPRLLMWKSITGLFVLVVSAIVLLVLAVTQLPDSDSDATTGIENVRTTEARPLFPPSDFRYVRKEVTFAQSTGTEGVILGRDESDNITTSGITDSTTPTVVSPNQAGTGITTITEPVPSNPTVEPFTSIITVHSVPAVVTLTPMPGTSIVPTTATTTVASIITPPTQEPITTELSLPGGSVTTIITTPSTQPPYTTAVVSTIVGSATSLITPSPTTFTTTLANVTSTIVTSNRATPTPLTRVFVLSDADVFVGTFLPTIFAAAITIPLQLIDVNAKLFQPFHALTLKNAVGARDSLILDHSGFRGHMPPFFGGSIIQAVPTITTLLVVLSWAIPPLASETVGLKIHGTCALNVFRGCALDLGVSVPPTYGLLGLLGASLILLVLLLFSLAKWRTGLEDNPFNLARMASLRLDSTTQRLINSLHKNPDRVTRKDVERVFSSLKFWFRCPRNPTRRLACEIQCKDPPEDWRAHIENESQAMPRPRRHMPFRSLTGAMRALFLAYLILLEVVISFYHFTSGDSAFERFMASQTLGLRGLFTFLGVAITVFWSAFFRSM